MLTKIRTIERLGVFGNFVADNNLPDFKRYNVIYGENGSGKTTLSRLIGSLQLGEHPEHPELRFSIMTQSGPLSQGQKYQRQVRVFNSDYIEASIGQFQTPLQHILIVGEENKALAEEVKTEKSVLSERLQKIDHANRVVERLENDMGKLFSLTAKLIGEATSGSIPRNYRKPQAEAAFAQNPNPKPLAEEQMNLCRSTVRQEPLNPISFNMLPLLKTDDAGIQEAAFEYAAKIPLIVKQLLQRSVQSDLLKKLEFEHPRIASWVEQGLTVHQMHGSQRCKFCDQPLPEARLAALMDHFGAEDQRLKQDILDAQQKIRETIESFSSLSPPSKLALYSELREDFEDALNILNKSLHELVNQLKAVHACLDSKLLERSKSYEELITLDAQPLSESLAAISRLINTHNSKTESFNQAKDEAAKALEEHYLSTIAEQVKELEANLVLQNELITKLTLGGDDDSRGLKELSDSIETKQAQISSEHAAGAELTLTLNSFLGRTDLRFDSTAEGYQVLRRGTPAKRLSEGEKTAIAFLYFIIQLRDQNFNLGEGVVVVDDPISSLDSASIYQAFGFLKNAVKDAKQIFLLTHNFDFLKMLIGWLKHTHKTGGRSYYMVVCAETNNSREARLIPLDPLLVDHPTEYHYLFKLLYQFKSDGTIHASYHLPNTARKFLETFLEFHDPSDVNVFDKLEAIDFDPNKKTAIYKFANDLSHRTGKGFDPALVAETQKNVTFLLDMIKAIAPKHYLGLEKVVQHA